MLREQKNSFPYGEFLKHVEYPYRDKFIVIFEIIKYLLL